MIVADLDFVRDAVIKREIRRAVRRFQQRIHAHDKRHLHRGIIRDAQVQLELLEKFDVHGKLQNVTQHLQNQIADQQKKLTAASPALQLQLQKLPVTLPAYFNQIHVKQVAGLCAELINKLQKKWTDVPGEKKLHSARKAIKHLLYVHDFLVKCDKKQLGKKRVKKWDELQQVIGNYHDCSELIKLLKEQKQDAIIQKLQEQQKSLHKQVKQSATKAAG